MQNSLRAQTNEGSFEGSKKCRKVKLRKKQEWLKIIQQVWKAQKNEKRFEAQKH